jgi:hypothetical protein
MTAGWTRRRFLAAASAAASLTGCGGVAATAAPRPPPARGVPAAAPASAVDVALSPAPRFGLDPYRGLGCWLDVFDWSSAYGSGSPRFGPADMASLAGRGVRTVFLQTARVTHPSPADDLLERDRLFALVDAAHAAGLAVVAWYLPTHVDQTLDLRRAYAVLGAGRFDGFALDIESRAEPDVALRNARLADLVTRVRRAAGTATVGAIVVPPTTIQDVNPNYWPGFDWALLAALCDVFVPMNYWTNRLATSPWSVAGASTTENIRRLRTLAGRADYPVHVAGGIANLVTEAQVRDMVAAVRTEGAIGASLYDVATTPDWLWPALEGVPAG